MLELLHLSSQENEVHVDRPTLELSIVSRGLTGTASLGDPSSVSSVSAYLE